MSLGPASSLEILGPSCQQWMNSNPLVCASIGCTSEADVLTWWNRQLELEWSLSVRTVVKLNRGLCQRIRTENQNRLSRCTPKPYSNRTVATLLCTASSEPVWPRATEVVTQFFQRSMPHMWTSGWEVQGTDATSSLSSHKKHMANESATSLRENGAGQVKLSALPLQLGAKGEANTSKQDTENWQMQWGGSVWGSSGGILSFCSRLGHETLPLPLMFDKHESFTSAMTWDLCTLVAKQAWAPLPCAKQWYQ